jgi:hypothetical protein
MGTAGRRDPFGDFRCVDLDRRGAHRGDFCCDAYSYRLDPVATCFWTPLTAWLVGIYSILDGG